MDPRILQIETIAMHAWPAREIVPLDGWLLRTHPAPSRRVNSVWPNGWEGRLPLVIKIERVEGFYKALDRPARYQVCPVARPEGLDAVLAARGYRLEAPTFVQIAETESVIRDAQPASEAVLEVFETLTDPWLSAYCRAQGAPISEIADRRAALVRIEQPVCYVQASVDGEAVAVGRGVLEAGWMGIFGMATHTSCRRQGLGSAVLHALATCAHERGVRDLYLQVMENNPPARALYAGAGFETLYGYHYRSS